MASTGDFVGLDGVDMPRPSACGTLMFRAVSFVFGAALIVAAIGLWMVPGSSWSAELLLIKTGLTALFGLGGMSFLQAGRCRRRG